jgi:hypothetical protein
MVGHSETIPVATVGPVEEDDWAKQSSPREVQVMLATSGGAVKLRLLGIIFGPEKPSRTTLQTRFLSILIHAGASTPTTAPVTRLRGLLSCV